MTIYWSPTINCSEKFITYSKDFNNLHIINVFSDTIMMQMCWKNKNNQGKKKKSLDIHHWGNIALASDASYSSPSIPSMVLKSFTVSNQQNWSGGVAIGSGAGGNMTVLAHFPPPPRLIVDRRHRILNEPKILWCNRFKDKDTLRLTLVMGTVCK